MKSVFTMFLTLYEAVKGKIKGQKLFLHKKKSHKPNVYRTSLWQGHKDSNSGHVVLETTALPTELYPCICVTCTDNASYFTIKYFVMQ